MDGNNSLKRMAMLASRVVGDTRVLEDGSYFLPRDFVDRFANEVRGRQTKNRMVKSRRSGDLNRDSDDSDGSDGSDTESVEGDLTDGLFMDGSDRAPPSSSVQQRGSDADPQSNASLPSVADASSAGATATAADASNIDATATVSSASGTDVTAIAASASNTDATATAASASNTDATTTADSAATTDATATGAGASSAAAGASLSSDEKLRQKLLKECVKNWKAASADEKKKMWSMFEESGIFASACRHGCILWLVDMVRSGEL